MSEFHADEKAAAAPPATGPARWRRKRRWVAVVAPLAAAAAVAAVLTAGPGHQGRTADAARPAPSAAATLLENAAAVVSRAPSVPVGHDQYVYVRSVVTGRDNPLQAQWTDKQGRTHRQYARKPEKLARPESMQQWIAWSHDQAVGVAYGDKAPEIYHLPAAGQGTISGGPSGFSSPLADLAALPADPAEAMRTIGAQLNHQLADDENTQGGKRPLPFAPQLVFAYLGGMLAESVDPQTTAFLYRVAAEIPHTTVVPDAADAAGRHGVAITIDGGGQDREEWIFDRTTYAFLGYRDVTVGDTVDGKAGSVLQATAVLRRAVVDRIGDTSAATTTG
jgi:hypothetical protein